jgi:pyridoxamine 5'-phosphate oxidase family protein
MTVFSGPELAYLQSEPRLGRLATVGPDGTPHVAPVGWNLDPRTGVIEISGHDFAATKKFRDVGRTGRAALVIDDVLPPWHPRGVEIRGRAEALGGKNPRIRIHPERIVAWGIEGLEAGRTARDIATG